MYLTLSDVRGIGEDKLREFLEKRIPEGHHLDYKKDLIREGNASGSNLGNGAKREFLKDITGFANANGGDILLGVNEPSESTSVDEQLVGIDDGNQLAQSLERLARDSVDPPIPGLHFEPVSLRNGKVAMVVHIPPTNMRPHRVNHSGHVGFYMRHSESTFSMNTYQIREAVLASASAEIRAKEYMNRMLRDTETYVTKGLPVFLLQAMPMITPEKPWNVLSSEFFAVIRDSTNRRSHLRYPLVSTVKPTATLEGIKGRDDRQKPTWTTEIHRNGYIAVADLQPTKILDPAYDPEQRPVLTTYECDLFHAFAYFCKEVLEVAEADSPYLVRCQLLDASGVSLYSHQTTPRFHGPWAKPAIVWEDQIRQVGEEFTPIADQWCQDLLHAFGLDAPL